MGNNEEINYTASFEGNSKKKKILKILCCVLVIAVTGVACALGVVLLLVKEATVSQGYPEWQEVVGRVRAVEAGNTNMVRVEVVGETVMGRPIHSVVVRHPRVGRRPVVWVVCGLHAREWTSTLTCLHVLENLIKVARVTMGIPTSPDLFRSCPPTTPCKRWNSECCPW